MFFKSYILLGGEGK